MNSVKFNQKIQVVTAQQESYISKSDIEMDKRVVHAVRASIKKAEVCNRPIARYDVVRKKAYLEYANGERKYVE